MEAKTILALYYRTHSRLLDLWQLFIKNTGVCDIWQVDYSVVSQKYMLRHQNFTIKMKGSNSGDMAGSIR